MPKGSVSPSGPTSSVEDLFAQLTSLIGTSPLRTRISTPEHKEVPDIAQSYLEEARKAYAGKAMVACIVMLGAMLEALMMGTLIRDDFADSVRGYIDHNPRVVEGGSIQRELNQKIVDTMTFEKYRKTIEDIIPASKSAITIQLIQDFRNSLHANKALRERMYINADEAWVDNHLRALVAFG